LSIPEFRACCLGNFRKQNQLQPKLPLPRCLSDTENSWHWSWSKESPAARWIVRSQLKQRSLFLSELFKGSSSRRCYLVMLAICARGLQRRLPCFVAP